MSTIYMQIIEKSYMKMIRILYCQVQWKNAAYILSALQYEIHM